MRRLTKRTSLIGGALLFATGLGELSCRGDEEIPPSDGPPLAGGSDQGGAGNGGRPPDGHAGEGGHAGQAGSPPSAGGSGGTPEPVFGGAGGRATSLANLPTVPCTITITRAQTSPRIPMVGLVEFDADLPNPTSALVQFGDGDFYELEAPVDLTQLDAPTWLLGMASHTAYHFRVVVLSEAGYCASPDQLLVTGGLPAGGPADLTPTLGTSRASAEPGFVVTSLFNKSWAVIVDHRGRIVWSYKPATQRLSRARLSYDGRSMYARTLNLPRTDAGDISKISMDGLTEETLVLPGSHHDFTVLPDGGLAYIGKSSDSECDSLYYHPPGLLDASEDTEFFRMQTAFPSSNPALGAPVMGEQCHTNSLNYHPEDGSFTASDLVHDSYVKVSATGELEWVLGADDSTFTGDALPWQRQHGHHLVDPEHLLIFNNGILSANSSRAFEIVLDLKKKTATLGPFSYEPSLFSSVFGDVQRLPSGHTLVTFSVSAGILHEVDEAGALIQALDLMGPTGYSDFRTTLYGPPLR